MRFTGAHVAPGAKLHHDEGRTVAKLGEAKPCAQCGGRAILRILRPSVAILGWVDGQSVPYDVPSTPMWQCEDCDDRQLFDGELED